MPDVPQIVKKPNCGLHWQVHEAFLHNSSGNGAKNFQHFQPPKEPRIRVVTVRKSEILLGGTKFLTTL